MSIVDALRRGVDHLPGGRPVVALRLGRSDEVTRKELSGTSAGHKLGAVDALAMAVICVEGGSPHAYDYARAVASECGGRFELTPVQAAADQTPMQQVSSLVRETSDVTSAVITAMSNNTVQGIVDINDNQLAAIERELDQAEAQLQLLRHTCRSINLRGKPGSVQAQSNDQWRRAYDGATA